MLRMSVKIVELKKECEHLRWIVVRSLGGRKYGFCNLPGGVHFNELCPVIAGEECREFKEKERPKE